MKIPYVFAILTLTASLCAQRTLPESKAHAAAKSSEQSERAIAVESSIAVSDSGVQRLIVWLNEWDALMKKEEHLADANPERTSNLNLSKSNRTSFNSSRSNLYRMSAALNKLKRNDLHDRAGALKDLQEAASKLEEPLSELYNSVLAKGEKYSAHAAELKLRHEAVKNAVANIKA